MREEEKKIAYLKVYYASLYKILGNIDFILSQEEDSLSYKLMCELKAQIDAAGRVHEDVEKFLQKYYPEEYKKYEETIERLQTPKKSKIVI